tara:strand:+ start:222 stop:401 length:180 start_codon:yes stop_codon:yes gene_type:complete
VKNKTLDYKNEFIILIITLTVLFIEAIITLTTLLKRGIIKQEVLSKENGLGFDMKIFVK